ncbi:MAG: 4-hydroxythreonine-4-phosphate dehydrogenase PdxA [Novosphingobium sp.]
MTSPFDPLLAVSLGDPAGVGPELWCEAWVQRRTAGLAPFFVIGSADVLAGAAAARGIDVPVRAIDGPDDAPACFATALPVLDIATTDYDPGQPNDTGAELAFRSLEVATGIVRAGGAAALVTGPVSKAQLAKLNFSHPGQTEYVAERCGIAPHNAVMLLAGPTLKVVPITVHVALAEVPALLTTELIRARSTIAAAALIRDFGIAAPRLAVAGLNPHAGEGGRFGEEEQNIIQPAIEALREEGLDVSGPHSPDAMFHAEARRGYDAAVCMYHDQALIPLKTLDFENGVNLTLGLPIVRTSPDHGTAFAIAGRKQATPGATIAAIRLAGDCAARRAAAG